MPRTRLLAAALACGSLLPAACGNGSGAGDHLDAAAIAPSTMAPAAASALARQALLTASDVPAGWTEVPHDPADDIHFAGEECAPFEHAFNGTLRGETVEFASPEVFGIQVGLEHTVAVTDPDSAAWAGQAFAQPNAVACFEDALRPLAAGVEGAEVRAEHTSLDPSRSARELKVLVTLPIEGLETPITYVVTYSIAVRGDIVSTLAVTSTNYVTVDAQSLAAKAATRLAAVTIPDPSAPPSTTTPAAGDPGAALLTIDDLPDGWTEPGPAFRTVAYPGDGCAEFEANLNGPADGVQVEFERAEATGPSSVVSHVVSVTDSAAATWAASAFADPRAQGCVSAAIVKRFERYDVEVASLAFDAAASTPAQLVASVVLSLPDGTNVTYRAQYTIAVHGTAVSTLTVITAPSAPIDPEAIAATAAGRLGAGA